MTLTYDAGSDTYSNLPGVKLRPIGWANGTKPGKSGTNVLYRYQFGAILKKLHKSQGYQLGKDVFIAPYDWRLAGDAHATKKNGVGGFYKQFQELVEIAVQKSGGKRAVVLSHSLGCPTMHYFFHTYVSEAWRAQYIHGWVALSSPWMGGISAVTAYIGGWNVGLPSWLVPHDYVKRIEVNASSAVWTSPHPKAYGNKALVVTPSRKYTAADIPDMIRQLGPRAGGNQTASLFPKLQEPWAELQRVPVNVPLHNWYSTGVKTPESFVFDTDLREGFNQAPDKTLFGEGDGLVNLWSLQQVEEVWPKSPLVSSRVFSNCSHFGILSDARVLSALADYMAKPDTERSASLFV